jgi:hypothetical protein
MHTNFELYWCQWRFYMWQSMRWTSALSWPNPNVLVGSEVLTAMVMKSSVFWNITLCSPLKGKWHCGGTCCLHLQGQIISQGRNQCEASSKHCIMKREMPVIFWVEKLIWRDWLGDRVLIWMTGLESGLWRCDLVWTGSVTSFCDDNVEPFL